MYPSFLGTVMFVVGSVGAVAAQEAQPAPTASTAEQIPSKAMQRDADVLQRFPPPGRMVDVGGRKLHLLCKGKGGGPTVILEGGALGLSYLYWKAQDEVAKQTQACTYDRAGLGWSDSATLPRSLEARVDDLHALLLKSGLHPPYILAGHSMGGLLMRMYAHKYPSDVVGLLLVEPSNERVNATEESRKRSAASADQLGMAIVALRAGNDIPQLRIPGGPPEQEIMQRESVFRAGQDDLIAMSHVDEELARFGDPGLLGNKPLIVITRGNRDPGMTEEREKEWRAAHEWLTTLSTRSALMVAENSGHNVNFDRPDLYLTAVQKLLEMQ